MKEGKSYTFAVVPKRTNSPYWQVVKQGCELRAKRLTKELSSGVLQTNVTCLFMGPAEGGPETEANQVTIVEDLIDGKYGPIDGLALAVVEEPSADILINKAVQNDIQVVTFDTDSPSSKRLAYIGTDNVAMGRELGRVLIQNNDGGGTYGMVGTGSPNIRERYQGVRESLANSKWIEAVDSPKDCGGNASLAVEQMSELVEANPTIGAIIPVGAWPMFDGENWQEFVDNNLGVITVVGDALDVQIELMNMGYANALAGQLPFEMGKFAIDKLLHVRKSQENGEPLPFRDVIFPTSFIDVVNLPQDLPPIKIDMNYIGNLSILGYVLCAIVCTLSIGFGIFAMFERAHPIIRKSQPLFLLMVCIGSLIMGMAILPMSMDDEHYSERGCSIACMAVPWLISIGFVTMFSALFSKVWRVNQIFNNPNRFRRIKVTEKDVIRPFAFLLAVNLVILICWTVINPLTFERKASSGTDHWNRSQKSFYGSCVSSADAKGGSLPYLIILTIVNFAAMIIANIQAYQARNIHVEFSESRYIALATASVLQAFIFGVPLVALIKEDPQANYIAMSMLIFIACTAVLLLLFVPKILYLKEYNAKKAAKGSTTAVAHSDVSSRHDTALGFNVLNVDGTHSGVSSRHDSELGLNVLNVDGTHQVADTRPANRDSCLEEEEKRPSVIEENEGEDEFFDHVK
ncbi:hypothetical protein ACHAXR_003784 [Thalassiosira sp. AJA248-18]